MTPLNTEQLATIHAIALRTIEQLPQDNASTVAKLYCEFRKAGESRAAAELRASNDAGKTIQAGSIREKNIWVRTGLGIGIDAWFEAYKIVTG